MGLRPEAAASLALAERIDRAETALRDRGQRELPILAWALLQEEPASAENARRAVELAPATPAVLFEAARRLRSPLELVAALLALGKSFPGVLWLGAAGMGALGIGILLTATLVIVIGFIRTIGLHGHVLGHLTGGMEPPAWPGVLLGLAALALLPLAGIGPAGLLAAMGVLAAMRARMSTSIAVAVAVAGIGIVLGPLLDGWSRFAVLHGRDMPAMVTWRVDRTQQLPGDRERLERAVAREPDDLLLRLGLASAAKSQGDIAAARAALEYVSDTGTVALHAVATSTLGILYLADGEVNEAIAAFEDARSMRETAAVHYNLSQAYARGMRLMERTAPFSAARDLDPELVSRYTSFEGKNIHRFLIQEQIPLSAYVERALRASPEAEELAYEVRLWTLGPGVPAWSWLLFPLLGVVGLAARRTSITRCSRCERPLCASCAPGGPRVSTCVRCTRLFARGQRVDPRMRKLQLDLDRRRQRRRAWFRSTVSLLLPGAGRVLEGKVGLGALALVLTGMGAALVSIPELVPVPLEVGALGRSIPMLSGLAFLVPAYLFGLFDAREHLRRLSRTRG